jgi:type IV pilus assembly protein PilA
LIGAIHRRMRERENDEGGFTLIELMVVVMIIAILIGIAIPAFLGARKRAQNTAAKSNLRNSLSSATAVFSDNQTFLAPAAMVTTLTSEEPSISFKAAATDSAAAKEVSVNTISTAGNTVYDEIVLAAKSGSGSCFFVRDVKTPDLTASATSPASGTFLAEVTSAANCNAAAPPANNSALWGTL